MLRYCGYDVLTVKSFFVAAVGPNPEVYIQSCHNILYEYSSAVYFDTICQALRLA